MAAVFDILREERDRLKALKAKYVRQLEEFPRGSLSHKPRGNKSYCYLVRREGKDVRFEYIGPSDSKQVLDLRSELQKRDELRTKLRQVDANLQEVERGLRGQ